MAFRVLGVESWDGRAKPPKTKPKPTSRSCGKLESLNLELAQILHQPLDHGYLGMLRTQGFLHMGCSLNSLKGVIRDYIGTTIGLIKGDTRSLDSSSYVQVQPPVADTPHSKYWFPELQSLNPKIPNDLPRQEMEVEVHLERPFNSDIRIEGLRV